MNYPPSRLALRFWATPILAFAAPTGRRRNGLFESRSRDIESFCAYSKTAECRIVYGEPSLLCPVATRGHPGFKSQESPYQHLGSSIGLDASSSVLRSNHPRANGLNHFLALINIATLVATALLD